MCPLIMATHTPMNVEASAATPVRIVFNFVSIFHGVVTFVDSERIEYSARLMIDDIGDERNSWETVRICTRVAPSSPAQSGLAARGDSQGNHALAVQVMSRPTDSRIDTAGLVGRGLTTAAFRKNFEK